MQDEPFDFGAFMARASNPDLETKKDLLREAVGDKMETVMGEVAPRIWAILVKQMGSAPADNIHLNAVINSAVFAVLTFVAACTPRGETNGLDNDAMLTDKVVANLKMALDNGRENGAQLVQLAQSVGEIKLLQDSNQTLGQVVVANSMVLKGLTARLGPKEA